MGVRFCSLHQLYKKFSGNEVFPSSKLNEVQKQERRSLAEIEVIFPRNQEKTKKKRSSPRFATIFGRKFVGSFMNNFEVVQNLKMTFNKVDFILLLQ